MMLTSRGSVAMYAVASRHRGRRYIWPDFETLTPIDYTVHGWRCPLSNSTYVTCNVLGRLMLRLERGSALERHEVWKRMPLKGMQFERADESDVAPALPIDPMLRLCVCEVQ